MQGNPIMKITDLSMNHHLVDFVYENAFPFAEKFNSLITRLIEFAVFPDRELYKIKLHNPKEKLSDIDDTIIKTALSILFIGLFSAALVFGYELYSFFKIKKKSETILVYNEKSYE